MDGATAARRKDRKLSCDEKEKHPGVCESGSTSLGTFWKMGQEGRDLFRRLVKTIKG